MNVIILNTQLIEHFCCEERCCCFLVVLWSIYIHAKTWLVYQVLAPPVLQKFVPSKNIIFVEKCQRRLGYNISFQLSKIDSLLYRFHWATIGSVSFHPVLHVRRRNRSWLVLSASRNCGIGINLCWHYTREGVATNSTSNRKGALSIGYWWS